MFNRKSDYALNKKQKNAIIYMTAKGQILLTRADFSNEEEFQKWKAWSDQYYRKDEKEGRRFSDQNVPVQDWEALVSALFPSEESDIQQNVTHDDLWYPTLFLHAKNCLTKTQYCRLMLYLNGMTVSEIAKLEGVSRQAVSKSILASKRRLRKFSELIVKKK
ncbi:MAG: hypothetical protein ACI3VN_08380 [Candidatus Onthomonas sp.]